MSYNFADPDYVGLFWDGTQAPDPVIPELTVFDDDGKPCIVCDHPTENSAGQRIHCDCTWVPEHLDW